MNPEKLCMGCMKEINNREESCPYCGYRYHAAADAGHCLKPYTILNGKYMVGRVLGEGGFGITYIGYDLNLEMAVAIKEYYPNGFVSRESNVTSVVSVYTGMNPEAVQKGKNNFIREARTLARCSNFRGIVGIKDFFEENGTAYIVMEYLEGMTLKAYVQSCGGKVELNRLLKSLEPVMVALAQVHSYGLIHRDISPDNIMLMADGSMKLLDFGAARDYVSADEKSLSVMLKPGYAPEEQYRTKGKQGPWSDVYALTATIYRCITGVTPPESMERMRKDELKKPSELGAAISPQAEAAMLKGMAVYAEDRYQSVTEFMSAIGSSAGRENTRTSQTIHTGRENIRTSQTVKTGQGNTKASETAHAGQWKTYIGLALCVAAVCILVIFSQSSKKNARAAVADDIASVEDTTADTYAETELSEEDAAIVDEMVRELSGETEEAAAVEEEEEDSGSEPEEFNYGFAISADTKEDYSANLSTRDFEYYTGEIDDFNFWYPTQLYNHVEVNQYADDVKYGYNLQTITFTASNGSALIYSITRRRDSMSLDEITNYVYVSERNSLNDPEDIINTTTEDHGKVIVSGWDDMRHDRAVYDLLKTTDEYVLQMTVYFPDYTSEEDRLEKAYVTECLYRLCGFSGSSKPTRSYADFLEENQE